MNTSENQTASAGVTSPPNCAVVPGSDSVDMTDDPQYQAWVESMAKHCRCDHDRPCAGVLAGGLCDDLHDDDLSYHRDDCPTCRGSGQYDDCTPCPDCDGDGTCPW